MDPQSLRHLHGLRDFIRNLVEQADRSGGCECHRPPSLLLVGPPGAGKTYLVKQMSTVCEMPLFGVHTHQLSGPTALRNLFVQARELDYPSLFFLDDIDHIFDDHDTDQQPTQLTASLRHELYKQLGPRKLKIFDNASTRNPVQHPLPNTPPPPARPPRHPHHENHDDEDTPDNNGLILVAATSSPWLLYKDHELLSRFRGVYLVGLPDRETRFHLLKYLLQKVQHNLTEKEMWLVADKTEGYTPSDLMIITKALNYEQFSFLFSMAGLHGYGGRGGEGETSEDDEEESISSSSEMTETDVESNYDHVDTPAERVKQMVAKSLGLEAKTEGEKPKEERTEGEHRTESVVLNNASPKSLKDTTINQIEKDWSTDDDEEKEERIKEEAETKAPETEREVEEETRMDADGASGDVSPVEVMESDAREISPEKTEPSVVSSNCDNSSNVMDSDVKDVPGEEKSSSVSEDICEDVCDKSDPATASKDSTSLRSEDEEKEFELHVFHPPEPFQNDNQAIDSGSDSDNETGGDFATLARRVNFCNVPSMQPLSVDVDHSDNMGLNNSHGYEPNVTISSVLEDTLLSKDTYCGPSADNILKRLLASSSNLHDDDDDTDDVNLKNNARNKQISPISKDDRYRRDEYLDVFDNTDDLVRRSPIGDETDNSCGIRKENSQTLETFLRSPSIHRRNSLSEDRRSLTGRSRSPPLRGSPQLTPTGSDTSSHLATDNSSESGSGRRISMITPTPDNENNKTRDSDSSLYGKSETPTIPSSDVSTATCNVSGETLECQSDSDERLRNIEEDLKAQRRPRRVPASEDEDDEENDDDEDDLSGDESDNDALRRIFNLNNLGEVSIKILTLADVLNVVSRTPKSVSDEEIKRYTDFMVWFANVAKSACPHNSKGALSDSASSADASGADDNSLWSQSPSTKKRKGPLRKLGRFLLKALMFILD